MTGGVTVLLKLVYSLKNSNLKFDRSQNNFQENNGAHLKVSNWARLQKRQLELALFLSSSGASIEEQVSLNRHNTQFLYI